jgi:hypothetical protein
MKGPLLTCNRSVLVLLFLRIVFESLGYGSCLTTVAKLTNRKGKDKLNNKLANFKTHRISISSPAHPYDTTNVTAFPVVAYDGKLPIMMNYFGIKYVVAYYNNVLNYTWKQINISFFLLFLR